MVAARISSGEAKLKLIGMDTALPSEPEYKRRRLLPCGKVCIICLCGTAEIYDYVIFIVDPNDDKSVGNSEDDAGDGFVLRFPTLRLDFSTFSKDAFCVLGSTLFVFEGCRNVHISDEKSVFTFDLSSIADLKNSDTRLDKTTLKRVGEMRGAKKHPQAIPTPDGKKILVFSTTINHTSLPYEPAFLDHADESGKLDILANEVDFELYDTEKNYWIKLPRLCHTELDDVYGFTIDYNSNFLLLSVMGFFSLNLGSVDDDITTVKWTRCSVPKHHPETGRFFRIEEDLFLGYQGTYETSEGHEKHRDFDFASTFIVPRFRDIALLGELEDGECDFCILQAWTDGEMEEGKGHLVISVCSVDLNKYRDVKQVETRIKKTFKFIISDMPCYYLWGVDMLSM